MSVDPSNSRAHLRLADADRALVHNVLTTAYAEGRITRDELEERSEAVIQARTFGDLEPITADLMPSEPAKPIYSTPVPVGDVPQVVVDPSGVDTEVERITSIMSTKRREYGWRMRRRTSIGVVMGDAKLDLTTGVMEAPLCHLDVNIVMGDVVLKVPDGVRVVDETTAIMADVKLKGLRPLPAEAPTIVLRGLVLMGEVVVKGPDHVGFVDRLLGSA